MAFFSFLLTQLMAAYTVLVEPFLRTNFYRMLKKQLNTAPDVRILYYRTQVLWEWSWVVVLVVITIPISQPLAWIGLALPNLYGWFILAALLLGVGLSIILLRRNPRALESMQHSIEASSIFLPTTPTERKWFVVAALTAGICEELLYRGFLTRYLSIYFPSFGFLVVSILSGIIYGLSRAYQGLRGILQTALTGFSYAIIFYLSGNLLSSFGTTPASGVIGSLLPVMVFHAAVDLRTLFLWTPGDKKKKTKR
jgi:membrane protease YdiL (CAAX protease family)